MTGRMPDAVPLLFEQGAPGRSPRLLSPMEDGTPLADILGPDSLRTEPPPLPELSEVETVRHYARLASLNYGVDDGPYPLGSCTMKHNPRVNEDIAAWHGFSGLHPYQDETTVQGALQLMAELEDALCAICGLDGFALLPAAGAHGELTGLMILRAALAHRGEGHRSTIIVPDAAHGTNPASASVAGFRVREIRSGERGTVDLASLDEALGPDTAGLMLTNPNTLGLFESDILAIADRVHRAGGLLYYDGANANAILGRCRPGDMGFDIVHLNLHKTFSTPHGGGGPGAGPVGVTAPLVRFLPVPRIDRIVDGESTRYAFRRDLPDSIGPIRTFHGNFGVLVRAYAYIRRLGAEGLREVSEAAVVHANYLLARLRSRYDLAVDAPVLHEFVLTGLRQKNQGSSTLDLAKGLIDAGFHPPTVYFPLIVREAMMVEPTETETRESLDALAEALLQVADLAASDPGRLHGAPVTTPISRPDEIRAARTPVLRWIPEVR